MELSNIYLSKKTSKRGTLPIIKIENCSGSLEVSPFGATILSWRPAGKDDVLWLSPTSPWGDGPVRGGVPVCFPWFGPNREHSDWPLHGFIRDKIWDVDSINSSESSTTLTMSIDSSRIENMFGYGDFKVSLEITLAKTLSVKFNVTNTGKEDFSFENGLHTYFSTCPQEAVFRSFDGGKYYDKVNNFKECRQSGDYVFTKDREAALFFVGAPESNTIDIKKGRITVTHDGFRSAVIWSPGEKAGLANPEIGIGWKDFVCLESANCIDDKVTIKPGETHSSTMKITLE